MGSGRTRSTGRAVAKIFAAKERPRFNPLIVHVRGVAQAETYAVLNATARKLAEAFWPGALSLVLEKRAGCGIADLVTAGLDTIALRVPAHPVARALLADAKLPIAAPSANRSGRVSPTTAAHVAAELGEVPAMILDGGAVQARDRIDRRQPRRECACAPDSALPRVRRSSGLWVSLCSGQAATRRSPRQGNSPRTTRPIRGSGWVRQAYAPDEALLAFGRHVPKGARFAVNLSESGDLNEAAAKLFGALRELDQVGVSAIAVMPIPDHGLGEAINDRLQRATCGRPPRRASDQ